MVKIFALTQDAPRPAGGSMRKKAGGSSRRVRQRRQQASDDEDEEDDENMPPEEDAVPEEEVKSSRKAERPPVPFRNKTDVNTSRVAELREFCALHQLDESGKKAELVARVWSYVSEADE